MFGAGSMAERNWSGLFRAGGLYAFAFLVVRGGVAAVDGDEAVVRVADDGPGIPPDPVSVYLRGSEQSPTSTGDGLGLSLASTLVDAYGGTFTVGANEPRGAAFELRLPLATDA
jgi:signal transduction histidine kinase